MRRDGRPTARDRARARALADHVGLVQAVVEAEEGVAIGVESGYFRVGFVEGVVITALPVLGLVNEHRPVHFDLPGAEVPLEVRLIVPGVPEAELDEREKRYL